jgi:tetratricopeptide (TPR) repeat protein
MRIRWASPSDDMIATGKVTEALRQNAEATGDLRLRMRTLYLEGCSITGGGALDTAGSKLAEALSLAKELEDPYHECGIEIALGAGLAWSGKSEESHSHQSRALELAENHRFVMFGTLARDNLAMLFAEAGKNEEAKRAFIDSIKILEEIGHDRYLTMCYRDLSFLHVASGEFKEARRAAATALRLARSSGDTYECANMVHAIAAIEVADGDPRVGLEYLRSFENYRSEPGAEIDFQDRAKLDRALNTAQERLGPEEAARICQEGKPKPIEEAIVWALSQTADHL